MKNSLVLDIESNMEWSILWINHVAHFEEWYGFKMDDCMLCHILQRYNTSERTPNSKCFLNFALYLH